jgi:micrococcal nuclease
MNRDKLIALFAIACAFAGTYIAFHRDDGDERTQDAIVQRVIDGDTIELDDGTIVRYIGMNTPESVDPDTPVQCFAHQASLANERLVLHRPVHIVWGEGESYGRRLGYVYVGRQMINMTLVLQGFATVMTIPPNDKYRDRFIHAQSIAHSHDLGLWKAC